MRAAAALTAVALLIGGVAEATPRAEARRIVNRHRIEAGCDPIAASRYALRKAQAHSREMAEADELFHSDDLASETGWSLIGEVVGTDDHWRAIIRALFRSLPHRRLLLDCRYDVGAFGIVFAADVWITGRLYAT